MVDDHDRLRKFLDQTTDDVELVPQETVLPVSGKLGKYLLKRELGRGGMAIVYEAEDPELKRRVALKVLREASTAPAVIQRFHREAAIAAQLQHPNIVAIHEVGMTKDEAGHATHFIAMDLVEGRTLSDVFGDPRVARDEKLRMLEDIARAAAYAHSKGVIHRDLKPGNVLVAPDGRALLTDFGLAHAGAFQTKLTQTRAVMGTPHYMSPEQVAGRTNEIDERADVYALGVMLYELMTGRPPFEADTPAGVYYRILEEEPARPSRVTGERHVDLELVCLKSMAKDRGQRYADALAFADDLHRCRKGEPVLARPPSLLYRLRKGLAKRKAILVTVAVAAVIMGGILVVIRYSQFRSAKDEAMHAFAAKDWRTARDASRRALSMRQDETLALVARECDQEIYRQDEEQRKKVDEADAYKRFKERLAPVETLIKETRAYFYARQINIREKLDKVERALAVLEEDAKEPAIEKQPEIWALIGTGRYFTGEWTKAEESFLRALELGSKDGWVHYYLGRVFLDKSMVSRLVMNAAPEEENLTARKLSERGAAEMVLSLAAGAGAEEVDRKVIEAYLELAKRDEALAKHDDVMARKNDADVLRICEEGLQKFPGVLGTEEFWNLRGWVWGNDRARQEECYTEALKIRPHDAFAHFMRAITRMMQNNTDGALEDLGECIAVNPHLESAYINRGSILVNRGKYDEGIADFNAGIRLNPYEAAFYANRGKALLLKGDVEGAMRDMNEAVHLAPTMCMAWQFRGVVRQRLGDWKGAYSDYNEASRLNPRIPEPYVDRGNILRAQGKFDDAIREYEMALKVTPKDWKHRPLVLKLIEACRAGRAEDR